MVGLRGEHGAIIHSVLFCSGLWSDDWHFALTIFLFGVLVCWVSSIEKINKHNNDAVSWSSPRNPKLMFVNICQCLFTFYLCNFMLNNAHLLLLACAFVSRFDYYSVYGSFNKDVLINLPKSWFISCFHFFLPMSEVCRFSPVVIFRLLVPSALVLSCAIYGTKWSKT